MTRRWRSTVLLALALAAACQESTSNEERERARVIPDVPSQGLLPSTGACTNCVFGPRTLRKTGTNPAGFDGAFDADPSADYMLVVKSSDPTARVEAWLNGVKVMTRGALELAAGQEATAQLQVKSKNLLQFVLHGQAGVTAIVAVMRVQAAQLVLPGVSYGGMTFSAFHLDGAISATGRFEFTPLPAGVSQVVFLESPNLSDAVPIVVPATAGTKITVDPTLIAKSYVALHPDLGPVSSAEQPRLFAKLDSMPSMAALTGEVGAALRAGQSVLDWPAAETPAKAVIAELLAASVSPRLGMTRPLALQRPFGTVCPGTQPGPANRTPLVCRDPQGVWGIENPRALFLGARIDGNDMPFADPADFQSQYLFFRTTVPRWTGFQTVSLNAPHELELYDGFGTGSDLVTTGANSALIIGKGLQSFGIPALEVVNCGVAVFRAGGAAVATVTASVTNAAANWRGSGNIKLFASTLSSVTGLIGTCVKAAIGNGSGISGSTKWWANAFNAVSKLLKSATWVLSGGAASELGYVLAAAFDPLPSNRYAFYDNGVGRLTVGGAIWFTSNVAGATVTASGTVQGTTPLPVIDLPVGSVPYSVSAAGHQTLAASATTRAGQWTLVHAVLTSISQPGLIAHYPFDGNANDVSGNGYHAIVSNAALTAGVSGQGNTAYGFNGTNAEIRIPAIPTNGLPAGTISMWVRLDDTNAQYNIFAKVTNATTYPMRAQYGGGPPITQWCFIVNTQPPADCSSPVNSFTPASTTYGFTSWHLYTFTWSPSGRTIYLDGNPKLSISGAATAPSVGDLVLSPPSALGQERLKGSIDDVRIYNYELTQSQVAALVNTAPGPVPPTTPNVPPGLVAYYPMDGNGSDASGFGNHGTLSGVTPAVGHTGVAGTALLFAGANAVVTIPSNAQIAGLTGDMTLAFWVKRSVNPIADQMIPISRREFGNVIHFETYTQPGGFALQCCSAGGSTPGTFFNPLGTGLTTLNDGNWHRYAIVRRFGAGGFTELYLDGVLLTGTYLSGSASAPAPSIVADLLFGRQASTSPGQFEGYLDNILFFNTILTPTQIAQLP